MRTLSPPSPQPSNRTPPRNKRHRPLTILCLLLVIPLGVSVGCTLLSPHRNTPPASTNESMTDRITTTPGDTTASPDSATGESESLPLPPLPDDPTVEDLRSYYEALLAHLNQTLTDERAAHFVAEYNYQKRIEELERALEEAKQSASTGDIPNDNDRPVNSQPIDPPDISTDSTQGNTDGNTNGSTSTDKPGQSSPTDPPIESNGTGHVGGSSTTPATPPSSPNTNTPSTGTTSPNDKDPAMDYTYTVENGRIILTEYIGSDRAVVIPSTIENYPVVAIADDTFKDKGVTSVAIPDSVTTIGWFAFYGCHELERVTIPASVTAIGYAAFDGCPSVTIYCATDTYAAAFAASFGIEHKIL